MKSNLTTIQQKLWSSSSFNRLTDRIYSNRREILWLGSGQLLGVVGAAMGIKLLTNVLGPEGYGEVALVLSIATGIQQLIFGPIEQSAARYYAWSRENKKQTEYFFSVGMLIALLSVAVLLIVIGCIIGMHDAFDLRRVFWGCLASIIGIALGSSAIMGAIQNAARQRSTYIILQAGSQWLRPGAALLFLVAWANDSTHAIAGIAFASILIMFIQILMLKNLGRGRFTSSAGYRPVFGLLIRYALPFFVWGIASTAQSISDKWFIFSKLSATEVGMYVVMVQICTLPLDIGVAFINNYYQPIFFERLAITENPIEYCKSSARVVSIAFLIILLPMLLAYSLWGQKLISLMSTRTFATRYELLLVILYGFGALRLGDLQGYVGVGLQSIQSYLFPKIFSATFTVVLQFVLVCYCGLPGIAIALALGGSVYVLTMTVANHAIIRRINRVRSGQVSIC